MQGILGDIGFIELLNMVGKRTGRLRINTTNQQLDWYIHDMRVYSVRIDDRPVSNQLMLHETAVKLINDEESSYSFVGRELIEKFPIEMSFNLERIIIESLASITPLSPCRRHFPNAETKFVTVPNCKFPLNGELLESWKQAEPLFFLGASPTALAARLRRDLDEVRFEFYRWRLMGLIAPLKLFAPTAVTPRMTPVQQSPFVPDIKPEPSPPTPPTNESSNDTAGRGRIYYQDATERTRTAPVTISRNEERQGLIRRMLGSFFNR